MSVANIKKKKSHYNIREDSDYHNIGFYEEGGGGGGGGLSG